MNRFALLFLIALPGCGGIAYNTHVADEPPVRRAMVDSIVIGKTTETQLTTRWGRPVQKVREGGQVEYIYRNMKDDETDKLYSIGDSTRYVIVTFQYGTAIGVRSSDTEGCRATFQPRPPGQNWDNPFTVHPLPSCPGLYQPGHGSDADTYDSITDDNYDAGKAS